MGGAQDLGSSIPNMQEVAAARGAAGALYDTIDRVSQRTMYLCIHT